MDYKIIKEPRTHEQWIDFANMHQAAFTSDTQRLLSFQRDHVDSALRVKDVSSAYRTGKDCVEYVLMGRTENAAWNILALMGWSVDAVVELCESAVQNLDDTGCARITKDDVELDVYCNTTKGVHTFSPLPDNLKALKPLKELPKKWQVRHVLRMLTNGQYADLKIRYKYSDDYAYDDATNCSVGRAVDPMVLMQKILQIPTAYWFRDGAFDGDELGIHFHNSESIRCQVCLAPTTTKKLAA